jgi:hypothetical protein
MLHSQVYSGKPDSILAVEPSLEMSRLGQRIGEARAQLQSKQKPRTDHAVKAKADIRWASALPSTSRCLQQNEEAFRCKAHDYDGTPVSTISR